jgi:2-methylisocitrate lyase-like PEP mutase family enzyme
VFEAAGAPAIGTTSAGVAYALGRPDGERLPRAELLEAIRRIAAAVEVPVSADIESGFGATPQAVAETVRAVIDAGAVGINLEDGVPGEAGGLRPLEDQLRRLEAAREAAEATGSGLFVNARTDTYLARVGAPGERLSIAQERLRAFVAAGADGVFVPGLADPDAIRALVETAEVPLNVLASPSMPPVAELEALGVARLSVGSGPMRATLDLCRRIAAELQETGRSTLMGAQLPYEEANALFGPRPVS